jgi:hypothetical protein
MPALPTHAEIAGLPCQQLDAQDGPLPQPYPYAGWHCRDITLVNVDGSDFDIRLRWNRAGLASRATVTWLAGGDGRTPHAGFETGVAGSADPRTLRSRLDQDRNIRSIEIQFLNPPDNSNDNPDKFGGYWAAPRAGYLKAARAYRQALAYLRRADIGLIQGDWLTQVGSSNGATVVAFSLAYLGAGNDSARVVFVSGPFVADIQRECRDPGFSAYTGINDQVPDSVPGAEIRRLLSFWNGWPDCADAQLIDERRSLLGPQAQMNFAWTEIAVVLGAADAFSPWLQQSNGYWYDTISAFSKQRIISTGPGHDVFGDNVSTETLLFDLISRQPVTAPLFRQLFSDGFEDN